MERTAVIQQIWSLPQTKKGTSHNKLPNTKKVLGVNRGIWNNPLQIVRAVAKIIPNNRSLLGMKTP